ncbi:DsbC family protein [Parachitinimonas caeni]|uniref:DsbC family protein n=1 Tax=Parachitinimonas caeni TaxID=3031301 RepID=A0ABT7DUW1_9NEIS|nr:DsbC family protein [Parachitinimonas caeni]MDK2123861.1 DsbC family protein [Parachitinimonas caeni]
MTRPSSIAVRQASRIRQQYLLRLSGGLILGALGLTLLAQSSASQAADPPPMLAKQHILEQKPVGLGGLIAYRVEKEGKEVVLYGTADRKVLISGVIWNAETGENLSDRFAPKPARPNESNNANASTAIPPQMRELAKLSGVQEGVADPARTVYIVFDPRCPHCHTLYRNTRSYVAAGHSIKWLPATVLGDGGEPLAAAILQGQAPRQILDAVMTGASRPTMTPSPSTSNALAANRDFFFSAFRGVGNPGVPTAFYLDRKTGRPRMMPGASDPASLQEIFGS